MSRRISRAARRYLLTGQPEPYAYGFMLSGGRWALELPLGDRAPLVRFFRTPDERDAWVRSARHTRSPVGRRHPLVKTYRNRASRGSLSGRISTGDQ